MSEYGPSLAPQRTRPKRRSPGKPGRPFAKCSSGTSFAGGTGRVLTGRGLLCTEGAFLLPGLLDRQGFVAGDRRLNDTLGPTRGAPT